MMQDIANNGNEETICSQAENETKNCFDMSKLFKQITQLAAPPSISKGKKPPFVVRVIFVFGRSNCALEFADVLQVLKNVYLFFFSYLTSHEDDDDDLTSRCEALLLLRSSSLKCRVTIVRTNVI